MRSGINKGGIKCDSFLNNLIKNIDIAKINIKGLEDSSPFGS